MTEKSWDILEGACQHCRRCRLWEMRTHVVVGKGNPKADILFVGEGPGQQEDLQLSLIHISSLGSSNAFAMRFLRSSFGSRSFFTVFLLPPIFCRYKKYSCPIFCRHKKILPLLQFMKEGGYPMRSFDMLSIIHKKNCRTKKRNGSFILLIMRRQASF